MAPTEGTRMLPSMEGLRIIAEMIQRMTEALETIARHLATIADMMVRADRRGEGKDND